MPKNVAYWERRLERTKVILALVRSDLATLGNVRDALGPSPRLQGLSRAIRQERYARWKEGLRLRQLYDRLQARIQFYEEQMLAARRRGWNKVVRAGGLDV